MWIGVPIAIQSPPMRSDRQDQTKWVRGQSLDQLPSLECESAGCQCPDQAQQFAVLGATSSTEKLPDFDIGRPASRWGVGLVPDEHLFGDRFAGEKPPISVCATVELSFLGHGSCS